MSLSLIHPGRQRFIYGGFALTALAAGAIFTPWEPAKIFGQTALMGLGYGIPSRMLAFRDCIDGFSFDGKYYPLKHGERPLETRSVRSLNPDLNAIVFEAGLASVFYAAMGSLFALCATMPFPGLKAKVSSKDLLPYLALGAVVAFTYAHFRSRAAEKRMEQLVEEAQPDFRGPEFYPNVPGHLQSKWEAYQTRFSSGFFGILEGSSLLLIAIIAARMGYINLSRPFDELRSYISC